MLSELERMSFDPVVILDNGSTYPPLLEWFDTECPVQVVYMPENYGKYAPFKLNLTEWTTHHHFAVSDPDLDISGVPDDLCEVLLSGFEKFPTITKMGLGIEYRDIPTDTVLGQQAIEFEKSRWVQARFRRGGFWRRCLIDSTMYLQRTIHREHHYQGLATSHPYVCQHLDWYRTEEDIWQDEEYRYYVESIKTGKLVSDWSRRIGRAVGLR